MRPGGSETARSPRQTGRCGAPGAALVRRVRFSHEGVRRNRRNEPKLAADGEGGQSGNLIDAINDFSPPLPTLHSPLPRARSWCRHE